MEQRAPEGPPDGGTVDDETAQEEPVEDEPDEDAPPDDEPLEDDPVDDEPVDDEPVEEDPVEDDPADDEGGDDDALPVAPPEELELLGPFGASSPPWQATSASGTSARRKAFMGRMRISGKKDGSRARDAHVPTEVCIEPEHPPSPEWGWGDVSAGAGAGAGVS
ncbi:MAG TPA: hypothetical protein VIY73_09985 [Polyangiaceae bacterium]